MWVLSRWILEIKDKCDSFHETYQGFLYLEGVRSKGHKLRELGLGVCNLFFVTFPCGLLVYLF